MYVLKILSVIWMYILLFIEHLKESVSPSNVKDTIYFSYWQFPNNSLLLETKHQKFVMSKIKSVQSNSFHPIVHCSDSG